MENKLYLKAILVCALLFLGSSFAIFVFKQNPEFYKIFNNQIASREVMQDIIKTYSRSTKPIILIMGDSVVYGSGMQAHSVRQWREHTIPAFLSQKLEDYTVIDISMDGSLPLDYLALYQLSRRLKVEWVILDINYRMFSRKYQEGSKALSRMWLQGDVPEVPFDLKCDFTVGDHILMQSQKVSLLFRYSEALRNSIFFPTREEKFNQWLRMLLPARAIREPEDKDMLLKLKIKPYYFTPAMDESNVSLQALSIFLEQMRIQQQKYMVFFTPQNMEFIEEIYAEEAFTKNMKYIQDTLQDDTAPNKYRYFDWSGKYPAPAFYDHCHLLPRYNEKLAQALADEVLEGNRRANAKRSLE